MRSSGMAQGSDASTPDVASRRQLASDLHDDTLPVLAAAALALDTLQREVTSAVAERLADIAGSLRGASDRLRTLALGLDAGWDDAHLAHALRALLAATLDERGVQWELEVAAPDSVRGDVRAIILRNVAEAARNAAQHGRPNRVRVTVTASGGTLAVAVIDDGIGFDPDESASERAGHLGLRLLRSRVEHLGGELRVVSRPGHGTALTFVVPYRA